METKIDVDEERMNKAVNQLKEWRDRVNDIIEKEFNDHIERAEKIHPEGARAVEYLKDYTLRSGKRIRPACIIAGYKGVGGKEDEKIFPASTSIEALQTYLLIHDDIMDEDEERRGGPALHIMYEEHFEEKDYIGRKEKFGMDMGIIAGDLANSYAVDQLAKSGFDHEKRLKALRKLEYIHRHTGFGQILDRLSNNKPVGEMSVNDLLTIHTYKTAHYTIAGPLELGAILGEGTEEQKEILKKYGMNAGKAFQLYDDILGLYGNREKLGKPVDSDLKEGKKTMLILKALENGDKSQKEKIKKALGNKEITTEEVKEVREIVKETGSYDYSQKKINELIETAKETVESTGIIEPEIKDFLLGIADYIITREV